MSQSHGAPPNKKDKDKKKNHPRPEGDYSSRPPKKPNIGNDHKGRPVGCPPSGRPKGLAPSGEGTSSNTGLSSGTPDPTGCAENSFFLHPSYGVAFQDGKLKIKNVLPRQEYHEFRQALGHNWYPEEMGSEEVPTFISSMITHYDIESQGDTREIEQALESLLGDANPWVLALLEEPKIVRALLSFGAKPSVIPNLLRLPYLKPQIFRLKSRAAVRQEFLDKVTTNEDTKWRSDAVFNRLRKAVNLSMRYDLHRGDIFKVTDRHKQFAKSSRWDCSPLFRAHFDIVGQEYTLKKLLNHVLMLTEKPENSAKPTVLLFAGPSGHGKTELAKQMERYLGLPFHSENMASVKREDEFFGPHKPYNGYERGSPVNNFLAANNGRRCIVFLDELEKAGLDVRNALLVPFERGATIPDRRGGNPKLDISKVIWILATDALDSDIKTFYETKKPLTPTVMTKESHSLVERMRKTLHGAFGAAFTSRIDLILPFFPFSPDEQAVLADLEIGERKGQLRQPISLDPKNRRLVGNINLTMEKDYQVCKAIAKTYMVEEGVRSIKREVDNLKKDIFDHYLDASDRAITEEDQKKEIEYILKSEKTQGTVMVKTGKVTPKQD
ncbi:hypothetical protein TWF281_006140 [Arthrobotrys megalospora]